MAGGMSRSLLVSTLINFKYKEFFSEFERSIELSFDADGEPEISFDPNHSEKYVYASFLIKDKSGKILSKVIFRMWLWNKIQLHHGSVSQIDINLIFGFTAELYRLYGEAIANKNNLERSLKKLIKGQKKRIKAEVKK